MVEATTSVPVAVVASTLRRAEVAPEVEGMRKEREVDLMIRGPSGMVQGLGMNAMTLGVTVGIGTGDLSRTAG